MTNFLIFIEKWNLRRRAAQLFAGSQKWVNDPEWTPLDSGELQRFFNSSAGRKLQNRMINTSFEQDRQATLKQDNPAWHTGYASGFRAAIAVIQSLSCVATQRDKEDGGGNLDEPGADNPPETKQAEDKDAAWLESISP